MEIKCLTKVQLNNRLYKRFILCMLFYSTFTTTSNASQEDSEEENVLDKVFKQYYRYENFFIHAVSEAPK